MKKDLKENEKIQTNIAEGVKSQDLSQCCEQNAEEKFDESAWRSRSLKFLDAKIDKDQSILVLYQYSRFVDDQWTAFVPYSSYSHFSDPKPDIKSIILGSLENLEVGTYLFKLIGICVYDDCWLSSYFDSDVIDTSNVLKLNVFDHNGTKGFEVIAFLHMIDLRKEFKK